MAPASPRLGTRLLMALVGVVVFAFYAFLAYGCYLALSLLLWTVEFDPVTGLSVVVVLTAAFGYLGLRVGARSLLSQLDARELPRRRVPGAYRVLDRLVAEMDLDAPRLMVVSLPTPNAFAIDTVGRDTVVLDTALFRLLDRDEFEALLAHELAHLERKDSLVQTLAFSGLQTVVSLAYFAVAPVVFLVTGLALSTAWIRGSPRSWPETLPGRIRRRIERAASLAVGVVALLARAHSRKREYAADARAAAVTGRPLALASALEKLERASSGESGVLSPLWVRGEVESEGERRFRDLFATHPRTEDRAERLRERAESTRTRIA